MITVAIIGCGRIVQEGHVPAFKALSKMARVAAISDVSPASLEMVGSALKVPADKWYTDYKKMLVKEDVDFVDIALPHALHKKITIDVANAGKNIISEKPLAVNLQEVDKIMEAVSKNKVTCAVLHNYRTTFGFDKVLELVDKGISGETFMVRIEGTGGSHWPGTKGFDPDWRTKKALGGSGCWLDNGYHFVYLAREFANSPIVSVYASMETYTKNIDVEDTAQVIFKHENGATSTILVTWGIPAPSPVIFEVHGKKASIALDWTKVEDCIAIYDNATGTINKPLMKAKHKSGFTGVFESIFKAYASGKALFPDIIEARKNLEAITAAYASAKVGKVIKVHIDPPRFPF